MPSGRCVCVWAPTFPPTHLPVFPGCPVLSGGVHGVKWWFKGGGSSHTALKGFSFLFSSSLWGPLSSEHFPLQNSPGRTKIPQCLVGGDANKALVPDECHCLWSPAASNTSLINFNKRKLMAVLNLEGEEQNKSHLKGCCSCSYKCNKWVQHRINITFSNNCSLHKEKGEWKNNETSAKCCLA